MQDTTDIYTLAGEAYDWFESAKRAGVLTEEDGGTYYRLKDGRPEWVFELVHAAHGDMFPDDWRYECIMDALAFIHDNESDDSGEFADQTVDVYTTGRLAWLASNLNRAGYCDDAASEFGVQSDGFSIVDAIGMGQYMEASEVFGLVYRALEERMEEIEDEDSAAVGEP